MPASKSSVLAKTSAPAKSPSSSADAGADVVVLVLGVITVLGSLTALVFEFLSHGIQ